MAASPARGADAGAHRPGKRRVSSTIEVRSEERGPGRGRGAAAA